MYFVEALARKIYFGAGLKKGKEMFAIPAGQCWCMYSNTVTKYTKYIGLRKIVAF